VRESKGETVTELNSSDQPVDSIGCRVALCRGLFVKHKDESLCATNE